MDKLREEIMAKIKYHESEVDNWNDAVFMSEYNVLVDDLVKLFSIHNVSKCDHEPKEYTGKYSKCTKCGMLLQMKQ